MTVFPSSRIICQSCGTLFELPDPASRAALARQPIDSPNQIERQSLPDGTPGRHLAFYFLFSIQLNDPFAATDKCRVIAVGGKPLQRRASSGALTSWPSHARQFAAAFRGPSANRQIPLRMGYRAARWRLAPRSAKPICPPIAHPPEPRTANPLRLWLALMTYVLLKGGRCVIFQAAGSGELSPPAKVTMKRVDWLQLASIRRGYDALLPNPRLRVDQAGETLSAAGARPRLPIRPPSSSCAARISASRCTGSRVRGADSAC